MSIFEIPKNRLLDLTDAQLEELVARLAEAEVSHNGGNVSDVTWSGSINAPDGGVDIRVRVSFPEFVGDMVKRPDTIFQVKKPRMTAAGIVNEMTKNHQLLPTIADQAQVSGAYIIVSLLEDNAEPERNKRLSAMQDAVADCPNGTNIALDFYDRSRLHQWLKQYPSVMLWVRAILGIPLSGWQPYGRWSPTPNDQNDDMIFDEGVKLNVPAEGKQGLSLEDALPIVRSLVQKTTKAIRIVGLSGVGKTRFVQALFDENLGENALDRATAIYVDAGANPDPSAREMIDTLISEERKAILVLDNCPSDLHATLASRISKCNCFIKLITVEYDIREDKPQTTEVVHIEACGTQISEKLVLRRFPEIGRSDAHRIAEFSNGNARIALAIAEWAGSGEALGKLSDADLFSRLFNQRNETDLSLQEKAEVLSLVYSYSVNNGEEAIDELTVLSSLCDANRMQMYRATATLLERQIAQKRSHWRAILPHAIANRLASSALNSIPIEELRSTFEHPDRTRLLKSFSRRLGYLHDHEVAQKIVGSWLSEEGLLSNILELNEVKTDILRNIAPVAPNNLLNLLEQKIQEPDFYVKCPVNSDRRITILNLLVSLAYEAPMFERCIELLIQIALTEDVNNNHDSARKKIEGLFQAHLSGTHATLEQRIEIVQGCLWSGIPERLAIGIQMLSTALYGPPWTGFGLNEFGARSRDYGYAPTYGEHIQWLGSFLSITKDAIVDTESNLSLAVGQTLAESFRSLWRYPDVRPQLEDLAEFINSTRNWSDGWKAVRKTIYYDCKQTVENDNPNGLKQLQKLDKLLRPSDLLSKIHAFVLSSDNSRYAMDDSFDRTEIDSYSKSDERPNELTRDLGRLFIEEKLSLADISIPLFAQGNAPFRRAFGIGLADSCTDTWETWQELLSGLRDQDLVQWDFNVLKGFIEGVSERNSDLAQLILDTCIDEPLTRPIIVGLHPLTNFTEIDLDRCISVLESNDAGTWMYGNLIWGDQYSDLPKTKIIELAQSILDKQNGYVTLLEALTMKCHGKDKNDDVLGFELRRIGLAAVAQAFKADNDRNDVMLNYNITCVLEKVLEIPGLEAEKEALLDDLFEIIDENHGFSDPFEEATQTLTAHMPDVFLNKVFHTSPEKLEHRKHRLQDKWNHGTPLAKVATEHLIEWCQKQNDPTIWGEVALGITSFNDPSDLHSFNPFEENGKCELTDQIIQFLEAAPDPLIVLDAISTQLKPMSWSGSRARIIEHRLAAFDVLSRNDNPKISNAAAQIIKKIQPQIKIEYERERKWDEEHEQTFE